MSRLIPPHKSTTLKHPLEQVAVTVAECVAMKHSAHKGVIRPSDRVHSVLQGFHASTMRGRGLMFEDVRPYVMGDDCRAMDWKVMARTGKPYVRVYSQERDRLAVYVVDCRITQFFGSQTCMKSVLAAKLAAFGMWRSLKAGDRVAVCVFNDESIRIFPRCRSDRDLMPVFKTLEAFTHQLADPNYWPTSRPSQLNESVGKVAPLLTHGHLLCVISDGVGCDDNFFKTLATVSQHNDILFGWVVDPLELELPTQGKVVLSDQLGQLHVDFASKTLQQRFHSTGEHRGADFEKQLIRYSIPFLPFSTVGSIDSQLNKTLAQAIARRSTVRGRGWQS